MPSRAPEAILTSTASVCDLAALHALAFAQPWKASDFGALMKTPGVFTVAIGGGELAGFILLRIVADEAEVLTLAVAPDRRRQGFGEALLAAGAKTAAAAGAARLYLEVASGNDPALRLYGKAGFRLAGRRKDYYRNEARTDALVLCLHLNR